jgi:hypothetical protein
MRRLALLVATLPVMAHAESSAAAKSCAAALQGATEVPEGGLTVISEEAQPDGALLYLQVEGQPPSWLCRVDAGGAVSELTFIGGEGG